MEEADPANQRSRRFQASPATMPEIVMAMNSSTICSGR
jgi:hypothetical protein